MQQSQHNKADGGKIRPALLIEGMPLALQAVSAVLTYGAEKYEDGGWQSVDPKRYGDAKLRHTLALASGEATDSESGLLHEAHEVCNALFILELKLRKLTARQRRRAFTYNKPPRDHRAVG